MELLKIKKEEFDAAYDELERNFVPEERRDREDARAILERADFDFLHVVENGEKVGFITIWRLDGFAFAEHFVTYEKYRSKGLGGRALELLRERYPLILLECEHPETPLKARRVAFYRRHGFVENAYPYFQPSYRGGEDVPLILMSCPAPLDDFDAAVREIYAKVYGK